MATGLKSILANIHLYPAHNVLHPGRNGVLSQATVGRGFFCLDQAGVSVYYMPFGDAGGIKRGLTGGRMAAPACGTSGNAIPAPAAARGLPLPYPLYSLPLSDVFSSRAWTRTARCSPAALAMERRSSSRAVERPTLLRTYRYSACVGDGRRSLLCRKCLLRFLQR